MKILSKHPALFSTHRHLPAISLFLALALSACATTSVEPLQDSQTSAQSVLQQQRFKQGKTLFLNKQYAQAASLLMPLAQQGHAGAQYTVGYMYHYGHGLPRNEKESVRWIATAAGHGHALAQEALTRIHASHDRGGVISAPAVKP